MPHDNTLIQPIFTVRVSSIVFRFLIYLSYYLLQNVSCLKSADIIHSNIIVNLSHLE